LFWGLALELGQIIFARQRVCGQLSDPRNRLVVVAPAVFGPRPFYVVGHNPNTIKDATHAVNAGANGLEPDVQVYGIIRISFASTMARANLRHRRSLPISRVCISWFTTIRVCRSSSSTASPR
jgi:hypothetical protein